MANGFHRSNESWERIESPLKILDHTLNEFASRNRLILTKNERDWPNRSFRWGQQPNLLIEIFLESEKELTYTMWVSASDERSREEYWKHKTLFKAGPIDALERELPNLLQVAYGIAAEWIKAYNVDG